MDFRSHSVDLKSHFCRAPKTLKCHFFANVQKWDKTVNVRATSSKVTFGGSPMFWDPSKSTESCPSWEKNIMDFSRVFKKLCVGPRTPKELLWSPPKGALGILWGPLGVQLCPLGLRIVPLGVPWGSFEVSGGSIGGPWGSRLAPWGNQSMQTLAMVCLTAWYNSIIRCDYWGLIDR